MEPLIQRHNLDVYYMAWEVDEACIRITHNKFPNMEHRGDVFGDSAQAIAERLDYLDHQKERGVLIASGPPCPDFSRIKGSSSAGRQGPEGMKFDGWIDMLEILTPLLTPRPTLKLTENVIPHRKQDIKHFERRLHCRAVQVDANIFGLISRPRLWWLDIAWDTDSKEIMGYKATWAWEFDTPKLDLTANQSMDQMDGNHQHAGRSSAKPYQP